MSKHGTFFRRIRKACLCLLALFMLQTAVVPTPAMALMGEPVFITKPVAWATSIWEKAKIGVEWVKNQEEWTSLVGGLISFYNAIIIGFEYFGGSISAADMALVFGDAVAANSEIQIGQALIDKEVWATHLAATVRVGLNVFPPKHEHLCKAILAHQMVTLTEDFEKEVSRMAAEAISNRFRCPTCDGSGPDYVGMAQKRRCEQKYGNARDGIQSACVSSLKGTDFRPFADADMMTPDGGQIYVMPKVVSRAYFDPVSRQTLQVNTLEAAPDNAEQMFWMAAWDHCFQIAGPRPTPRHGAGMKTPVGKTQRAMFNHCTASQNALVKQCTDLLAYYTRPNCTDTPDLCAKQEHLCSSVEGIVDIERFADCKKGLSPYEEQLIMQSFCKSNQHYVDQRMAGATDKDLSASSDLCEVSWSSWRGFVAQKHDNYTAAANSMQKMKSCWASVEKLGRGSASAEPLDDEEGDLAATEPADQAAPVSGYVVPAKASGHLMNAAGAL